MSNLPFDETVELMPLYDLLTGYVDIDRKITKNFTFGEYIDATDVTDSERENLMHIPIDRRLFDVAQTVRNYLGSSVKITSAYRSPAWEQLKGRAGGRDIHTHAKALDLKGQGLVQMIETAIKTKNQLYQDLIALGVTSFGLYDTFVHLDVDFRKADGTDRFWDNREKKKTSVVIQIGISIVVIVVMVLGVKRIFKKLF